MRDERGSFYGQSEYLDLASLLTCVQIRGEFMRASRVFSARPERAIMALAQLCEERKDDEIVQPDGSNQTSPFIPPQMSPIPAPAPHTVGSSPVRLNADAAPHIPQFARNLAHQQQPVLQRLPTLPEHVTPSHPVSNDTSSDTSDIITDDEMMEAFLDSVDDVRSYMDESPEFTRASSPASSQPPASLPIPPDTDDVPKSPSRALLDNHLPDASGSRPNNDPLKLEHTPFPLVHLEPPQPAHVIPSRIDTVKRVTSELSSLPALTIPFGYTYSSPSFAYYHRQPASPSPSHFSNPSNQRQQSSQRSPHHQSPQTVFYETTGSTPFKHSNNVNHPNLGNNGETAITYPYHYAYYSASPLNLQFEQLPQQQHYEGPIPGPSGRSVFGVGGDSMSVKSLPQHVLSARKRNSRRRSMSDGSSGKLSWKETNGSTNGNTRSNTPTTSSMTPPQHPRSLSREGSNSSRPPSRTQHSHSNSSVTVKPGTKQHQLGGYGQGIQQQQSYRLRNGSLPPSPVIYQDPSSPFSSPLQQHKPLSPSTSKPRLRKDPRNPPPSGVHLNSPRRGASGQLPHSQSDVSYEEAPDVAYNSRIPGSPCPSVSNGSATTRSAVDSSPGSISSTSSSFQSTFNRSMTDDSGFEVVSPFQSRIGRLPSSQHGYVVRRNGDGGVEVTVEGVDEGYRMMQQNLQELRMQKEKGGKKDLQAFQGGSNLMGVQHGGESQAQLQPEESTRRMRQPWNYQARRVVEGNGVVYHQPHVGMTVDLEGRKVLAAGDKRGKKW